MTILRAQKLSDLHLSSTTSYPLQRCGTCVAIAQSIVICSK